MNSLRILFSIVRFNSYLMNQQFLVNFFKKKIYPEISFFSFKIAYCILGIVFCTLMTNNKIFCLVFIKKILQNCLCNILFIEILFFKKQKLNSEFIYFG